VDFLFTCYYLRSFATDIVYVNQFNRNHLLIFSKESRSKHFLLKFNNHQLEIKQYLQGGPGIILIVV
jgi:hypothetical protein